MVYPHDGHLSWSEEELFQVHGRSGFGGAKASHATNFTGQTLFQLGRLLRANLRVAQLLLFYDLWLVEIQWVICSQHGHAF